METNLKIEWLIMGFVLLFPFYAFSQKEFDNWYFGMEAGLSFTSGGPLPIPNGIMGAACITVSVSDSIGNFLFFSNGAQVYNKNKGLMPNGYPLNSATPSFFQPVISAQSLTNVNRYFLFYVDRSVDIPPHGMRYSIINMTLNGGLGDIEPGMKNIPVLGMNKAFGAITGTRHANNKFVWIVTRITDPDSNYFASFLINQVGFDTIPVLSNSGLEIFGNSTASEIKISPDGNRLGCIYRSGTLPIEYCQFNSATGNIVTLFKFHPSKYNAQTVQPRSMEFSIDSRYLYVAGSRDTTDLAGIIYQYDATITDSSAFMQSETIIGFDPIRSALQIGPDYKIYASTYIHDSLHVINFPTLPGSGSGFQLNAVGLNDEFSEDGLPQFIQRYYSIIHSQGKCPDENVEFSSQIWPPADSIHWNFGDPSSGSANYSNLPEPSHLYATPGIYTVELFVRHIDNRTDTSWRTITIYQSPLPLLGPDRFLCEGDSAVLDAGFCTGCTYQWDNIATGQFNIGNGQTYTAYDTGIYVVHVTNPSGCIGRDTVLVSVSPGDSVQIAIAASANNVCAGTLVTFTATSQHGGTNPVFQWQVNGMNVGTNDSVYSYYPINGDLVSCILTSSDTVCIANNPASSNQLLMVIDSNLVIGCSIAPSANPVCAGVLVTFTATPVNGGTSPSFQWQVNGINVGTNNPTYSYYPSSADLISCVLTSSEVCTQKNPDTSNQVLMVIDSNLVINCSIVPSANPVCAGVLVTFTATPVNGGTTPSYQWQVNGINVGTNSQSYSYYPSSADLISCVLTSSEICTTNNPATSNLIMMTLTPAPAVTFTPCFDTITTTNAKPIKLKGGIPLGGTYSGPGVSGGYFYPNLAGPGTHIITYSYTNAGLCTSSATARVFNFPFSIFNCGSLFIDIRDNKSYPTIQLGGQCWFADDLNYGTAIPSTIHQMDNCTPEKYINPASSIQHPASVYQWDELMGYQETPGQQGLCPPGWHVPSESDWSTLFSNWTNNAFAAAPLKYSGYSGFNALLNGARHLTVQWDYQNFAVFFWSSNAHGPYRAWAHGMNDVDPSVSVYPSLRSNAFSVRCLKD